MSDTPDLPAVLTPDQVRDQRQDKIPSLYRTKHERLACELALKMETPEEVFRRHGYEAGEAVALLESPAFIAILERVATEVRETGLSFRMKARAIAEDLLPEAFDMATDPTVSSSVRLDAIKWAAKVADLEPRVKEEQKGTGGGLTLNIMFAGQEAPARIIEGTTTGGRE